MRSEPRRCLEDLERRIDTADEERLLAEWAAFADGRFEGDVFSGRRARPSPPAVEWPVVSVNAALADYEAMALQQFSGCSRQLADAGGLVLCVRCNYGTGILPGLFGAEPFLMDEELDTLPACRPLGGLHAIEELLERGVPDLRAGWGGKVLQMGERYAAIAERYPKIGRFVHVYHPDLQGPMDVADLLLGSRLFVALYDAPDLMKDLLDLICETYAAFMRAWERVIPFPDGHAAHWGLLHRGRIMLRDDSAMNLSPEMFDEFVRPYDARLLAEFGGGGIHFCGRGDHYAESMAGIEGLHAVNMSQPECNDMEEIFRQTVDRGINLIGLPRAGVEEALRRGRPLHGRVHCS
jgi:hypothetical protein